jgi:5-methylcytosine-specific restriction endonuclease McrA
MRKASKKQRLEGKQKQWQIENPDRVRELAKKHRNHDITDKEWDDCLKVFNYSCCYCSITQIEAKKRDKQVLHKDHVDDKGYNDVRNAAPACRSCNDKKWQHDMEEWFRQQEFFTEEKLEFIKWWITEGYKDYIEDKPPYKVTRSRIYKEDGSYKLQHELWTVDEQRNMLERIKIASSKKEIEKELKILLII